jgi:4-carboxymuconolactone decarboxylase
MNTRYEAGKALFTKLHGQHMGEEIVNAFAGICPDLEKLTMEWAFADILSRDGLDLKAREFAIIASLVTMGNSQHHIRAHIEAALNAGATQQEIVELILQLGLYCGFPSVVNAMMTAKALFEDREKNV